MVTGVHGAAGAAAAKRVTEVRRGATEPATTPDQLMVGDLVPVPMVRFRDAALQTAPVS